MNLKPVKIKKRGKSYQLYYYNPRGERRRLSVGSDYQHVQRLAVKFNDWLSEGKDPEIEIKKAKQEENKKAITFKDFFPVFMQRHGRLQSLKTQISYKNSFKNISRCPAIVNSEIGYISKSLIVDYMQARMDSENVSAATVNREAALLKCMLSKAVEWDLLKNNSLYGMKLFKESGKRDVNLTEEQAKQLIHELPSPIDDIVEFAIYTGFRLENILELRIESIRFHDLVNTGEAELIVKGGRRELFPLGVQSVSLLKRIIGKRCEGYVFINPRTGTRYISIKNSFNKAVCKLGLTAVNGTKFRFQDLRHLFATWLHRKGVSLDTLRPLMGHKDRATTDRYTTVDRLTAVNVLSLMPNLRIISKKESPDHRKAEAF